MKIKRLEHIRHRCEKDDRFMHQSIVLSGFRILFSSFVKQGLAMLTIIRIFPILLLWTTVVFFSFFNVEVVCAQKSAVEPVTIQLRWFHQFQFAGYYAAIEKGFYAEEGLQVSLREFEPGKDRVAPVLGGKAQYGVGGSPVLKMRAEGQPLVLLAQIFQHSAAVLVTKRDSGILSPHELVGKKVMLPLDDISGAPIKAMILETVGDMQRITVVPHTYNNLDLINGNIDAMATYLSNEPYKLKKKGVSVNIIDPRSYGIDFYGDNLFTTEIEIAEHPERVKKMIRATIKGWTYALEHKDEIIDLILTKYNPDLNREQLRYEAKVIDQMIVPDLIPIGDINPRRYERIAETYQRLGMSQSAAVPEGLIYQARPEPAVSLTAAERTWLKSHPNIVLGYTDAFEPEVIVNPDGSLRGIQVDILAELNRRLGTRIRLRIDPVPELVEKAQKREVDGILSLHPDYADKLGLLKTRSYITNYPAVFACRDVPFNRPSDLAGKKVAIIDKVFFSEQIVKQHGKGATVLKVQNALEGLRSIDNGQADFFLGASLNAYFITKYQLFDLATQYVFFDGPIDGVIGIRSDWPEVVSIMDKGLSSFSKEEIEAIVSKWIQLPQQKQFIALTPEEKAWLAAHPVIRIGIGETWSPLVIVKNDGSLEGFDVDLLAHINELTGANIQLVAGPWHDITKQAEQRYLDGLAETGVVEQRRPYFLFTHSYNVFEYAAIALPEQAAAIRSITDLQGKRIAFQKGNQIAKNIAMSIAEVQLIEASTKEDGYRMVMEGKADAALFPLHKYGDLRRLYHDSLAIAHIFKDDAYILKTVYSIRNDWPELVSILNKAITAIGKKEKDDLLEKWIPLPRPLVDAPPMVKLTPEERAWLEAHPNIEIGYTDAFEPEVITNPDGSHRGVLVDIVAELNRRLGTRIRLRIDPIPEMLGKARKKETDGILYILPEYADKLGLLKTEGHLTGYAGVFARRDVPFNRPSDLAGKKVAIIDGVMFSEKIVERYGDDATILKVKDALEGLKRVDKGEVDLFLGASINAYFLAKYQLFGLALQYVYYDHPFKGGMAIRSDWPELVSILNKGISSFSQKEIEAITAKWIALPEKQQVTVELTVEERAWLAQKHTVRVRAVDFPPFIIAKEGEEPSGIAIDYLHLITEPTGIRFLYDFSTLPFAEALEGLKNRKGPDLILTMMRTPERERFISFSNNYLRNPRVIFARTEAGFISGIGDLIGKVVAVPRGTVVHREIEKKYPGVGLQLFDTDLEALEGVATGKADAYIGNLTLGSYIILKVGLTNLKVAAPTDLKDHSFSFGVRKDWPELSTIINKGLDTISSEEELAIRNKYLSIKYELGTSIKDVLRWVLVVGGSAFGIVLLFVFWNRSLATKVRERTHELTNSNILLTAEVAQRTKAEKLLRESRDYLKNLTDSLPDAVFSVKMPERTIEWANDTFTVLGYEPKECVERTTEFLYPSKEDFLTFGDKLTSAIAEGKEIFHTEQFLTKKSGEIFPAEITLSFFKEEGELVSVTTIVRDIAERKQNEQALLAYQERLKALASQLTLVEEKERRRIAADLHDHVGQLLAFSRIRLATARKSITESQPAALLDDISQDLLQAVQETRNLMFDLSSPSMNEMGLAAAISEWLEEQAEKRYGLVTEFIADDQKMPLNDDMRIMLYRNVRELLTNVVKHAQAKKVSVRVEHDDDSVKIVVQDDGVGFDPDAVSQTSKGSESFGLFSIKERMTDLGGSLEIMSEPGKGCKATLTAPLGKGLKE